MSWISNVSVPGLTRVPMWTSRLVTVPASVGWDDVGSWAALPALRGVDERGNTLVGAAVAEGGSGNIAITDDGTLIALVGVSDLVVIKAGDAVLVIPPELPSRLTAQVHERQQQIRWQDVVVDAVGGGLDTLRLLMGDTEESGDG